MLGACDGGQSSDSDAGALRLTLQWKDASTHSEVAGPSAIDCNALKVKKITATVLSSDTHNQIQGGPWPCSWGKGEIDDIPPGVDYSVDIRALDSADRVIYYGRTPNVTIRKGYVTPVAVTLEAVTPTPVVSLVKDIHAGSAGSHPHQLYVYDGQLFFVARQPGIGFELFGSDGTEAGTRLIKDIHPNPIALSSAEELPAPSDMTECNGLFYFIADDGIYGAALWQTDGTPENTRMMEGVQAAGLVNPSHLIALNGTLYFSAEHSASGRELWQSNGSAAGTHLVEDIHAGPASSNPHELTVMQNWLYFVADDGRRGYEIWRTDGTMTLLVQDIAQSAVPGSPGSTQDSFPSDLTVVNNRLFCRAVDAVHGEEIWMITADQTFARADLVMDINAYSNRSSRPRSLSAIDDTYLAFSAEQIHAGETATQSGTELWLFNWPVDAEPRRVTDVNPGSARSDPRNVVSMGGRLYFTAINARDETHLWSMPIGTTENPTCLTVAMVDPAPMHLTVFEGLLYFSAYEDRYGRELWYTDGTRAAQVNDLCPGTCSSFPSELTVGKGGLFFSAHDPDHGKELYRLDHRYEIGP